MLDLVGRLKWHAGRLWQAGHDERDRARREEQDLTEATDWGDLTHHCVLAHAPRHNQSIIGPVDHLRRAPTWPCCVAGKSAARQERGHRDQRGMIIYFLYEIKYDFFVIFK
jgi:hypothetical protein